MGKGEMTDVEANLKSIRERIAAACRRCGRDPSSVCLIGVSKTVPASLVRAAFQAGLAVLGENYVQEARSKMEELSDLAISWHFIGHLQSNKARMAVESFDWIHTVDRVSLARELDRQAHRQGKRMPVLLEINVGDEASKSGVPLEGARSLFEMAASLDGLLVRGLMALPPYEDDPEQVRPYFRQLRELLHQLGEVAKSPEEVTELSMGMSHDFEVAIEEGATMVRVGTALFGRRPS
jgi:pyridoxal phosphate enzyme (YggS family)